MKRRVAYVALNFDSWLHDRNVPGVWWCELLDRVVYWGYGAHRFEEMP